MNLYTIDSIDELGPVASVYALAAYATALSPTDAATVPRFKRHS